MKPGFDYIGISTPFYCNDGQGNFLFHKRSENCRDEHGAWDTGAGQLEFGSSPEENALREVFEEYGCRGVIQEGLEPYTIFREWEGKKTHWIAFPFFVKVKPQEAKINEPEAMDELGWFRLDALPDPLHPAFVLALERYRPHFEKYRT